MKMLMLAAVLGLVATSSQASVVSIFGGGPGGSQSSIGYFTGTLTYAASTATSATLTVALTNTLQTAAGGLITGFAFNEPAGGNLITSVSLTTKPNTDWSLVGSATQQEQVDANPRGTFDIGAALGGNLLGGGDPKPGIARGSSASFVFTFGGTGLNTLTASSFTSTLNGSNQFFFVRFRGFDNGGSDKVIGQVVPEPGTYGALMAGAVALLAWRKRRKQ
jgi:hypothetical protein